MRVRAGFLVAVAMAAVLATSAWAEPRDIRVETQPLILDTSNPDRTRFGELTWLGGLVLRSSAGRFGGYSGLAVSADGSRLLALSDRASWITMRLLTRDGAPSDVRDVRLGSLEVRYTPDDAQRGRNLGDAEALAPVKPGQLAGDYYIPFEREHRIHRYTFDGGDFSPPTEALAMPASALRLPNNAGIEAMAVLPTGPYVGAVIGFSEGRAHKSGDSLGWIFRDGKAEHIQLQRLGRFDITDMAALPDGGLIVLERYFAGVLRGVFMRIRRIAAEDVAPGARLKGEVLYESEGGGMVDNMEAIAVHTDGAGRTVLTVMSDDNFNPLQRMLLMRFALD
jgi:hypothetical protein